MDLSNLLQHVYVPYSGKATVAVVKSSSGSFFPGVRIENIAFPLTISAIQNALFCCLSEGHEPHTLYLEKDAEHHTTVTYWKEAYSLGLASFEDLSKSSFAPIIHPVKSVNGKLQALLNDAIVGESDFPVSALLETENGFITGVNIETSDWNKGLCAERVALGKAISYGIGSIKALHICTRDGEYTSPCGACRQVIIEHLPHQLIHLHHADGTSSTYFSSDLLPYHFQSESLHKHSS